MVVLLGDADSIQCSLYYQTLEGYGGRLIAYSKKKKKNLKWFGTILNRAWV